MAELAKTFGARVRGLRQEHGLSQADLAERAHVSEEWIRRMERGQGAPSFETLEALSAALGVTVAALFGPAPSAPAERLQDAVGELDEEALRWLIAGARLLRRR